MQGFGAQSPQQKFFHMPRFSTNFQKNNNYYNAVQYKQHAQQNQNIEFDGKRLRKAVVRRTIDYNCAIIKQLEARVWQRDHRDQRALQPDSCYYTELIPPLYLLHNPINAVTTKFVRTSTNKVRCPIFCVAWTPEGRRLITGASSGEFTLWNGLTFNFETILQAHDSSVRCMVWSHNDTWMVTGDHSGFVKYWQSNMNNVKMFQAHKEPLRGISFCPTDQKFATCSDDGTVRIWDFLKCYEEKILRGHGADVKCLDWHPQKGLLVSGSKDSQQPIKLWDPKSGQSLATLHAHKSTVMEVKWNLNGNWLLTASRDHLIKLFDIRHLSQEVQTFRGHKKEVSCIAWHPIHESLFSSGGSDGAVMFWIVGADKEVGAMEQAHDSIVWSMAWHPLGHILCSGSNDHSSKFWTRNRPGDKMRDKYNLNTLPVGGEEAAEYDEPATSYTIPGMGLEHGLPDHLRTNEMMLDLQEMDGPMIPGLDFGNEEQMMSDKPAVQKKVPYAKPIPRQFQQQWMENKRPLLAAPPKDGVAPAGEIGAPPVPPPPPPPPGFGSGEQQQMFPPRMHEMGPCFPVPPRMPGPRMNNPQPRFDAPGMRPRFHPPPHGREEMSQRRGPVGEQHDMDQRSNPFQDAYENSPIQDSQLDSNSNFGDSDLRMLPQDTDSRNFQEDTRMFGDETAYHEERYPRSRSPRHEDPNNVSEFGYQDYDARNASNMERGPRRGGPPPHRGRGRGRGSVQVGGPSPNDYGDSDLRISDNDMRNHPPSHDIDSRNLGPQHEGMGGYGHPPRKRGWNDNSKLEDRPPYYADNQHDEHYGGDDYENNVGGGRGDGMKGRGMRRGMRSRGRNPYRGGRGRAIRIHQ